MQRSLSNVIFRIYIRTACDKQFDDFLLTVRNRLMQSCPSCIISRIHIYTISQVLFDGSNITSVARLVECSF